MGGPSHPDRSSLKGISSRGGSPSASSEVRFLDPGNWKPISSSPPTPPRPRRRPTWPRDESSGSEELLADQPDSDTGGIRSTGQQTSPHLCRMQDLRAQLHTALARHRAAETMSACQTSLASCSNGWHHQQLRAEPKRSDKYQHTRDLFWQPTGRSLPPTSGNFAFAGHYLSLFLLVLILLLVVGTHDACLEALPHSLA